MYERSSDLLLGGQRGVSPHLWTNTTFSEKSLGIQRDEEKKNIQVKKSQVLVIRNFKYEG